MLDAFGAVQCVVGGTQNRGGTLDVIITRAEDKPSTVDIICPPGGASDHQLVACLFTPPMLKGPSTEHSEDGLGESSTSISLELIFSHPASATASSVIPWLTMLL